ncbi:MAG: zinc-binding alcohol dehydrogenase [Armatimonadetes bacterium]|nr:zinc-binding alcohol dehydrogenase [Armatimonadota bacterium]
MPLKLALVDAHRAARIEYADLPLKPDEVRIATEYASGKHGTTFGMLDGSAFKGHTFDLETRLFVPGDDWQSPPSPESPRSFGTTGVGTVTETGAEVTRFAVGDRVFGLMDIKETATKPETGTLWHLGAIDPLLALCLEPAYVAFHCVRESQIRVGDTVAVIGLGALGCLAVALAKASGAEAIFAVDTVAKRRDWATANGATHAFNPATDGDIALAIHEATGGKGVDVAIELAGVYPALFLATRCVRVAGTVCSAGFYQGEAQGMWLGREWHHNRLTMIVPHGCGFGHPPRDAPRWDERRAYDALVSLMRQKVLTAPGVIDPVVNFADADTILETVHNHPDGSIKFGVRF